MCSLCLQGEDGLDGGIEHIEIIARYAVQAVGGGEVLDYLQLLVYAFVAVFYQEVHNDCRKVIRIELRSLPTD